MQPDLTFLIETAEQAGKMLVDMQTKDLDIHLKGRADLVTRADKAVDAFILKRILANFPDHSVVTEESGNHSGDPEHQWFVDPLDGTLNYAHGVPLYAVSIAYAYRGDLCLGVIYDPCQEECFSAEKGRGAFLNDKRMRVSSVETLEDSLLITGFRAALFDTPRSNLDNFLAFSRVAQGVRRMGSAALAMAYVACGRMEGHWEIQIYPWDIAAGILLVEEAGGRVSRMGGDPVELQGTTCLLAANPHIYPLMLDTLLATKKQSNA